MIDRLELSLKEGREKDRKIDEDFQGTKVYLQTDIHPSIQLTSNKGRLISTNHLEQIVIEHISPFTNKVGGR